MCGIAGIVKPKNQKVIKQMTKVIMHRGPDDGGFFQDKNMALGMRRLSIIDLEGGHQPMSSRDDNLVIVFNGEIYNYKELKSELESGGYKFATESDTEVVLAMYEKSGAGAVARLRGMFAFSIYDKSKGEVFLARDFFGIKPLYYLYKSGGVQAFASEVKSFYALPDFKPEVNDTAVFNYLSYQYNPLRETFFRGVHKLPPGHYMKIDVLTGKADIKRYWQFSFKEDESLSEEEAKRKIARTLADSVEHHMIADVPVGAFLSGGVDSSIIATLMSRSLASRENRGSRSQGSGQIKTFTVSFGSTSEAREARETAEPLGTDHREVTVDRESYFDALPEVVKHFDEPVADPSALGLYFLAQEASKEVKVVLSGEGADELFGGYNIYLEPFARRKISWVPKPLLRILSSLPFDIKGKNYAKRALVSTEERYIGNAVVFDREEAERLWKGQGEAVYSLKNLYKEAEGLSDSTKMQYIDIHTWLVGDILAKADKMTMAHSLELRVPFLDIEVAKLAETLPPKLKWRNGATKYALREAFKNVLPESTRTRRKLGFPIPIREWYTRESKEVYRTILTNTYIREKLDLDYVKKLIADHIHDKTDNSRKIYLLHMLALWYNVYISQAQA